MQIPSDKAQKKSSAQPEIAPMIEIIIGCKWSLRMLTLIRQGVSRPGAMTRATEGLTTKVQSDCLKKMVHFGILERNAFPEIPPRVEYSLTEFGQRFVAIVDAIEALQRDITNGQM